jgi:hypothetical protein
MESSLSMKCGGLAPLAWYFTAVAVNTEALAARPGFISTI